MSAALRGRTLSFPMINCGRSRCTIVSSHTQQMKVMADRLACKLAFCSCSNASFFALPPSIAIAPRDTHGHNFMQVSSKLMCTTTCPRAACPFQEVVPLPGGSGLRHLSMVSPRIAQEANTWATNRAHFLGTTVKGNKGNGLILAPRIWAPFFPRTVVSGSRFGGAGSATFRAFALKVSRGNLSPCLKRPCVALHRPDKSWAYNAFCTLAPCIRFRGSM